MMNVSSKPTLVGDTVKTAIDLSALPEVLRDFVLHCADALQVPPELPLMNAIASMAVAVQGSICVRVNAGYTEPLALYLLSILPPGERKSAVVELCKRPMLRWEDEQNSIRAEELKVKMSERRSLEKIIEVKRAKLASIKDREQLQQAMADIAANEASLPHLPSLFRLFADDITPEALAALLQEQHERMGIIEAEGGFFGNFAGRYSNGMPNLDLLLKAWCGESVTVDRRRDAALRLASPLLTVCVNMQPEDVKALAQKPGFRGRGLLARFLYFFPESKVGYRNVASSPMDEAVKKRYANSIREALDKYMLLTEERGSKKVELSLTPDAEELRLYFAQRLEFDMREGGPFEHLRDWANKLAGQMVRVAGILHLFKHNNLTTDLSIDAQTMKAALTLGEAFMVHVKAVFSFMGADLSVLCSTDIHKWLQRSSICRGQTFTARECFQSLRGKYHTMTPLRTGLKILADQQIIEEVPDTSVKVGRPREVYRVLSNYPIDG